MCGFLKKSGGCLTFEVRKIADFMTQFLPKPYRLHSFVQPYDWGTRDEKAFIPAFLGEQPEPGVPYAELWIGAHPKLPSVLQDLNLPLNEAIRQFPEDILGRKSIEKFGQQLPFLLKILSAGQALSIQLHPAKHQAERLHRKDPVNYPDANHKPEIAIALDSLVALAGFQAPAEIGSALRKYREIELFTGPVPDGPADEILIKQLYTRLMKQDGNQALLDSVLPRIAEKMSALADPTPAESQFLKQYRRYGNDIGLFSFFFLNLVELKAGQAVFTGPGVPHAYLEGNIVECMANSDNVVRAGLTPKFRDIETLLEIIEFSFGRYPVFNAGQEQDSVRFRTAAEEFELILNSKPAGYTAGLKTGGKPVILLVTEGRLAIESAGQTDQFSRGQAVLLPACLDICQVSAPVGAAWYSVTVPDL